MALRVLVIDKISKAAFAGLSASGVDVEFGSEMAAGGAKILVVRSTQVGKETIDASGTLALIIRAGSGTDNIDVAAASAKGIYVANCPGRNSVAVAELAFGLILAVDRRIPENVDALRQGIWNKSLFSQARGLKGRLLGLVGFGSIAREVAKRARAFGMIVIAYSRTLSEEEAQTQGVLRATSLADLFSKSDVLSLHVPLTPNTRGMVTRALIACMPPNAIFINTARAEVVDSDALFEAASSGRIRVGTDVYAREPEARSKVFEDPIGALPNVVGTHHIGASTEQAQEEIAAATVRIIRRFAETGEVENAVNVLFAPPNQGTLVVRHLDRVGVLASVLGKLKTESINVETMENVIFLGGVAACARIRVARRPSAAILAELADLEHVLNIDMI